MAGELFAEAAREDLAAFIEAGLPAQLAAIEAARGLGANSLGRPAAVLRGNDHSDPRDNKVEVESLRTPGPLNGIDRSIFMHELTVAFTLFSVDSQSLPVKTRMLQWETAYWRLMDLGASTLGGKCLGAWSSEFSKDSMATPNGTQIVVGLARVQIQRRET